MLLKRGMIGIYAAVAAANHMAPWGGSEALMGTNPLTIAVPAGGDICFMLDMASSVGSFGAVKNYALRGEPLPEGWMIDRRTGKPLTDSSDLSEGLLAPLGGHKGSGLAIAIGLLAGVLNGAGFGRDMRSFDAPAVKPANVGQIVIAVDPVPASCRARSSSIRLPGILPISRRLSRFRRSAGTLAGRKAPQDPRRRPGNRHPDCRRPEKAPERACSRTADSPPGSSCLTADIRERGAPVSEVPRYFMYFPGNYRWSSAFINMLGRTPFGGTDISELHKVGRALQGKAPSDDEAWFDAFMPVADEVLARGETFEASGHPVSAAAFYLRASHYYQMGERFRTPKDQRAQDAYRKSIDCFHRFAALSDYGIEVVEVPFVDGSLPGYFVPARNAKGKRSPCVVFFDGLDVTKEIQFLLGVPDLIKRGNIGADHGRGPAPANPFASGGITSATTTKSREAPAWIIWKRVRMSMPGRSASSQSAWAATTPPRMASMEPRFAACVAWGGDLGLPCGSGSAVSKRNSMPSMSVPGHHISWILGVDTVEEALRRLEPFRLDGVVQKMRCPFLVTHGEGRRAGSAGRRLRAL